MGQRATGMALRTRVDGSRMRTLRMLMACSWPGPRMMPRGANGACGSALGTSAPKDVPSAMPNWSGAEGRACSDCSDQQGDQEGQ